MATGESSLLLAGRPGASTPQPNFEGTLGRLRAGGFFYCVRSPRPEAHGAAFDARELRHCGRLPSAAPRKQCPAGGVPGRRVACPRRRAGLERCGSSAKNTPPEVVQEGVPQGPTVHGTPENPGAWPTLRAGPGLLNPAARRNLGRTYPGFLRLGTPNPADPPENRRPELRFPADAPRRPSNRPKPVDFFPIGGKHTPCSRSGGRARRPPDLRALRKLGQVPTLRR